MSILALDKGYGQISSIILNLLATLKKTVVGGAVSDWADSSPYRNNGTQTTASKRPTDNFSYLTFVGANSQNIDCGNDASLSPYNKITLYCKASTTSSTNFLGLIDKYIGNTSGYALFLDASKKPSITAQFSKTSVSLSGATTINDGVVRKIHGTIECTKKFAVKTFICNGEEPKIYKESGVYYMFYDRWDGSQFNIYYRSSTSHHFGDSVETLILSNAQYCCIKKVGSTYRLLVTISSTDIKLYTSSTLTSGYTLQGTLLTKGAAYDTFAVADPDEIVIGSTYFLYYSGFTAAGAGTICYATSATGAVGSYTKQGTCIVNGGAGTFDLSLTADPDVSLMPDGSTYIMFYTGYNSVLVKQMQGYATSSDGITWTKFSGNPIHYFSGESYEAGIYGPNEPTILIENGICRMWYRCDNVSNASFKIAYAEWNMQSNSVVLAGNETITTNLYLNNVLDGSNVISGALGLDYILPCSQNCLIGGDGGSTSYFTGDIYDVKIFQSIQTKI